MFFRSRTSRTRSVIPGVGPLSKVSVTRRGATTLLHDQYGTAIAVEVRNDSKQTLVDVPILVHLQDAKRKTVFVNDAPGSELSLKPLAFKLFGGQYDGVPPGRARREITDQVMTEIAKMTGQEEAGVYNERPPDS